MVKVFGKKRGDIHGGDLLRTARCLSVSDIPDEVHDFSVNVNPLGPPSDAKDYLSTLDFELCLGYPEVYPCSVAEAIARAHGVAPGRVLPGNGSTELFSAAMRALKPRKAVLASPCYSGYEEVCRAEGIQFEHRICADEGKDFAFDGAGMELEPGDLLFICNPNNPTGALARRAAILRLAARFPGSHVAVDESFMDYVRDPSASTQISKSLPPNMIVFKSLTKFFGIAGLRLGFMYAGEDICAKVRARLLPWNVNSIAQNVAPLLYSDAGYAGRVRRSNREERSFLHGRLSAAGMRIFKSETNFLLCMHRDEKSGRAFLRNMLRKGFLLRDCSFIHGLDGRFVRIAVLDRERNSELVRAAESCLRKRSVKKPPLEKKASSLMIVGTSSDSGKSLVTAALCRIFSEEGLKVSPFKAQNMALNSFVTRSGAEIGRAQAFQAACAGVEPIADMNPVLLKPCADSKCQVIVDGKVFKTLLSAKDYYKINQQVRKRAFDAYDRLSSRFDAIIMEGAGSPSEINLLDRDFVNMAMAEHAGADAILVADIDRGGVFASIYGTLRLLPRRWRKLVKGVIINKFRGDESLLRSGIERIEKLCGVRVLGVMPYVKDLMVEEEDSLALDRRVRSGKARTSPLDIAVVRYPHTSNYTDFLVFEKMSGCTVRYVERQSDFGTPCIVFLPGSKNSISDMGWMRGCGMAERIMEHHSRGGAVFGICGGYQMLGVKISDPLGCEGKPGECRGLGLLDIETVLAKHKKLSQSSGATSVDLPFCPAGTRFSGYEIHMGRTSGADAGHRILRMDRPSGKEGLLASLSKDGLVFGTYIHGFFDSKEMADGLVGWLCRREGMATPSGASSEDSFGEFCRILSGKIRCPDLLRSRRISRCIPCAGPRRRP